VVKNAMVIVTEELLKHSMKLFKPRCRTAVRQPFFSLRIVNEWNKLPQTVIEATSVNAFKNTLDRHWSDMGVYSWLATQPINNKYKYKYIQLPVARSNNADFLCVSHKCGSC